MAIPPQTRLLMGLGTVFVALVGVLVWGETPETSTPGEPRWAAVSGSVGDGGIVRVAVDSPDERVVLVRSDGVWGLTQPQASPADEETAESLVAALEGLSVSEPLGPTDGAPFGLDPGTRVETVGASGGTLTIWIGDDAPTRRGTYVRLEDGSIRVSRGPVRDRVVLGSEGLRSRRVVALSPAGVTRLAASSSSEAAWVLRLEETGWWLDDATGTDRADGAAVSGFLETLAALQVDTFVDGPSLLEPAWTLALDTLEGPRSVVLGQGTGESRMVLGSALTQPALARLPPSLAALDPARLRARTLFAGGPSEPAAFAVELDSKEVSGSRSVDGWLPPAAERAASVLVALEADRVREVPAAEGPMWARIVLDPGAPHAQEVRVFQSLGTGRVALDLAGGDPFWVSQGALDALRAAID